MRLLATRFSFRTLHYKNALSVLSGRQIRTTNQCTDTQMRHAQTARPFLETSPVAVPGYTPFAKAGHPPNARPLARRLTVVSGAISVAATQSQTQSTVARTVQSERLFYVIAGSVMLIAT